MNIQSSFYQSVNDIDINVIYISSFWTLFVGIHATERKSCTGVHEGHSTAAVQRLSSVTVCHLVSTPLNILKSGNAKKMK